MSLDNLEYNLLMRSVSKKSSEPNVPVSRLLSLLVITGMVTVGQLVLSQLTHCVTLLTLVHQNIYNILTLIVSVLTQWKSEEVTVFKCNCSQFTCHYVTCRH